MILIAKPSKPLERSVKGNIRRLSALDLYADEIEALYTASEAGAQKAAEAPQQPTTDSLRVFVQSVVVSVVGANNVVGPDDDVFELGVDRCVTPKINNGVQWLTRLCEVFKQAGYNARSNAPLAKSPRTST